MIKTYEAYNKEPKIGDWMIDSYDDMGEIIDENDEEFLIRFFFDNVATKLFVNKLPMEHSRVYVKYFGTKEKMEEILTTMKYNL